ncbi:MAG: MarR family winged helix-turn-helix transcriptional regulator [Oscillospiraceae bacterium]
MNETENIGLLIKMIHDAVGAIANMELKGLNLTMSQSQMLYFLYQVRGQKVTIKEIENHFCIRHATAIGIVNRLEDKEFVLSCGSCDDKRVRHIAITKAGEKIYEAILLKSSLLERKYLEGLTSEETEHLKGALTVINFNLQKLR